MSQSIMGNKLFVGSLSFKIDNRELETIFSAAGTVNSARVVMDKVTGRSKGFGFVEMSSEKEAKYAIDELNNKPFHGRNIIVTMANPEKDRSTFKKPRHEGSYAGRHDHDDRRD